MRSLILVPVILSAACSAGPSLEESVETWLEARAQEGENGRSLRWDSPEFQDLEELDRRKTLATLARIAFDPTYAFRKSDLTQQRKNDLHENAVEALGKLGDEGVLEEMKARLKGNLEQDQGILAALARRGRRQPLEEALRKQDEELTRILSWHQTEEMKQDACKVLMGKALLLTRAERLSEAALAYGRLKELAGPVHSRELSFFVSTADYNLACLAALRGEPDKAIDLLQAAIKGGFQDRKWIRKDEDLKSLRGTPRFEKLLADDVQFRPQ